jgi:hypothetical protein
MEAQFLNSLYPPACNPPQRANASTDVWSAENQRPFPLQQNLYFRPLLHGQGAYGSVPG